tara:strand:- start:19 stop:381 length:363 start_codon:yes stop_codon:yes gene_type:complete
MNRKLETPINDSGLNKRTVNILKEKGIEYFEQLQDMFDSNKLRDTVLSWDNVGWKTYRDIKYLIKSKEPQLNEFDYEGKFFDKLYSKYSAVAIRKLENRVELIEKNNSIQSSILEILTKL